MKKLRWQLFVVLLALGAIAVLLLNQESSPIRLPGFTDTTPQPEPGGVYEEALIGSFGRLNPILDFYSSTDHDVDRLIYSGLIRFDDRGLAKGNLADTWGISQDGTMYNFSIRSEAVWHDGTPVTSQDIIFTVDLLRDDDLPVPEDIREFWKQVDVKELDEKTIQFALPEPFAPFMDYLTFGVLPAHLLEGVSAQELIDHPFNLEPVGSGPYRFDHLLVENGQIKGVVLKAFEDFYSQRAFIEELVFKYYPDAASAMQAYRNGEVMGISQVSGEALSQALKEPNLALHTGRMPRLTMVILNLGKDRLSFFQEPEVRKALMKGLNREWMRDQLLGGQAMIANGPILPGTWAYYEDMPAVEYDPQAAIADLKKAGYTIPAEGGSVRSKEGTALSFELVYPDEGVYPQIAEAIQRDWARLGVGVTLQGVSYAELLEDYLDSRSYEAALVDLNLARSPDPDPYPFWHQTQATGGQNYASWDDRRASEFLEQARVIDDLAERTKLYRNFQVRFANELPALPLFYPVYSYAVDVQVQNVQVGPIFDPGDRFNQVTVWHLDPNIQQVQAANQEGSQELILQTPSAEPGSESPGSNPQPTAAPATAQPATAAPATAAP